MLNRDIHLKIKELDNLYIRLERAHGNLNEIRGMLDTDIKLVESCLDLLCETTTELQRLSDYKE